MCAQVDFLKLLYDRMLALHLKHADTADEWRFPRPSFKARILCGSCFCAPYSACGKCNAQLSPHVTGNPPEVLETIGNGMQDIGLQSHLCLPGCECNMRIVGAGGSAICGARGVRAAPDAPCNGNQHPQPVRPDPSPGRRCNESAIYSTAWPPRHVLTASPQPRFSPPHSKP